MECIGSDTPSVTVPILIEMANNERDIDHRIIQVKNDENFRSDLISWKGSKFIATISVVSCSWVVAPLSTNLAHSFSNPFKKSRLTKSSTLERL